MSGEQDRLLGKMPSEVSGTRRGATRYLIGVVLLFSVVSLWTASSFITASLETGKDSWMKPFFITYLNTSSFALYLIPTFWRYYNGTLDAQNHSQSYQPLSTSEESSRGRRSLSRTTRTSPVQRSISLPRPSPRTVLASLPSEHGLASDEEGSSPAPAPKMSIRETAEVAAWWSAVWFVANWAINASLGWTSVASVTILSSTSGFFTLALGNVFGVEKLTRTKVLATIASFIGVLLVTRSDSTISTSDSHDLPSHPILGDFAVLLSACFYAVYVVLLKVKVGDEDRADMQMLLGFAGFFSIVCLIPIFPVLHYTGIEPFELPNSTKAWTICFINMGITVSSDYLYVLAMLKTTPMVATIGLSLTIPVALVGSLYIPDSAADAITLLSLVGAAMVLAGFVILGWEGWQESKRDNLSLSPMSPELSTSRDVAVDDT